MSSQITADSLFVVSGGGRGITARCVVRLAQQYHCRFILLGRTDLSGVEPEWAASLTEESQLKKRLIEVLLAQGEKPTPVKVQKTIDSLLARREIEQTLREIRAAGSHALYWSVDITDFAALQATLRDPITQLGAVTGILHGAGNLADKLIENKTGADYDKVYAAKVTGLENLLRCIPLDQLTHLILFASVAGFYGNTGQADYALANEILNKTAFLVKQQHPACRVLSLNWGPWDGGMVTPALKEYFNQNHIEIIPVEAGTQQLVNELESATSETVQIIIGSPILQPPVLPDKELGTYNLRRSLTLAASPFLLDHVIGGNPVLPAICTIDWVANACEQLYPGYTFFSSDENKVLKGIVFDDTLATDYTLEVKEIARDRNEEVAFEATIWSLKGDGRRQYHYSSRPVLRRDVPAAPFYSAPPLDNTTAVDGQDFYRDGTLFHGPSFQGVRRVLEISRKRVRLECLLAPLSERQQGQFPVQHFNPYAVDVQLQGLLIWARHFYQAASLPLKIQNVLQYRTLPFGKIFYTTMDVQSSSESKLVADVTAYDSEGRVYTVVSGAEVTISKRLNSLFAVAGSALLPV